MNILDRSQRQQPQDSIHQQYEFLEHIIESLTYPFYVVDPSTYTVTIANSAARQNGLLPKSKCHVVLHNNASPCLGTKNPCPIAIVKETKQPTKVEHVHRDQEGNPRYTEIHAYPIFDPPGDITQIIEYTFDITERKKIEKALQESEARFRKLFDRDLDGIILNDLETGIIFDCNDTISKMVGREKSELIGQTQKILYPPTENSGRFSSSFKKHFPEQDNYICEAQIISKTGQIRDVEIKSTSAELQGKRIMMMLFRDITQRKRTQEKIQWLARFPSENPYPVLRVDQHGIILYANTASTALLKSWGCQIRRQLPEPWRTLTEEVIHARQSRTTEAICFQRTLSLTFTPVIGPEYVNIYGLDITERKQAEEEVKKYRDHLEDLVQERTAELTRVNEQLTGEIIERKRTEQALLKSEQQYRTLAEHVADGIGIAQDEKFMFVNEALGSILGYTSDQLLRIDLVDLFRHDYQERFRETLKRLEKGVLIEHLQAPCVTGDGREIWTEGYHSFIEWEGKSAILVTVRDITKRKLRELEIEEAQERLHRENIVLRITTKDRYKFGEIIGKSPAMQEIYELIAQTTTTNANVLISGESGTGKELVARTIHHLSDRGEQAFVPVNCGAIPEPLFESEFFGHRKGAFTGADRNKTGFFDGAHKGTLFLDEVGELTPTMQVKLLRAIETGEYTPVGVHTPRQADVRIIAATNKNLTEQRQKGLMREDFFYRIDVVMMTIPPLRKRKQDLPLLIDHFLDHYDPQKTRTDLPGKILEALYKYDWPGNIRELQNVLQRYLTVGHLHFSDTDSDGLVGQQDIIDVEHTQDDLKFYETLEVLEKRLITRALEHHHWHRSNTAAALGIPRRTLHRKMKKFGLA